MGLDGQLVVVGRDLLLEPVGDRPLDVLVRERDEPTGRRDRSAIGRASAARVPTSCRGNHGEFLGSLSTTPIIERRRK
jgi:hypothetical protein